MRTIAGESVQRSQGDPASTCRPGQLAGHTSPRGVVSRWAASLRRVFHRLCGARMFGAHLTLGRDNHLHASVVFDARGAGITTGDHVWIGAEVTIHAGDPHTPDSCAPIHIGHGVSIQPRCIVLPGVVIGDFAVVAAGSIVAGPVEPHTIVAGSPARRIGQRLPGACVLEYQHPRTEDAR